MEQHINIPAKGYSVIVVHYQGISFEPVFEIEPAAVRSLTPLQRQEGFVLLICSIWGCIVVKRLFLKIEIDFGDSGSLFLCAF